MSAITKPRAVALVLWAIASLAFAMFAAKAIANVAATVGQSACAMGAW